MTIIGRIVGKWQEKFEGFLLKPLTRNKRVLVGEVGIQIFWLAYLSVSLLLTSLVQLVAYEQMGWSVVTGLLGIVAGIGIIPYIYGKRSTAADTMMVITSFIIYLMLAYSGIWVGGMLWTSILLVPLVFELIPRGWWFVVLAMYFSHELLFTLMPRVEVPTRPPDFYILVPILFVFLAIVLFTVTKTQYQITESIKKTTLISELNRRQEKEEERLREVAKEIREQSQKLQELNAELVEREVRVSELSDRNSSEST